jgi:hypothetical protein
LSTIHEVLSRLLPLGSNGDKNRSLRRCPAWPPDLFAVAATLLENSSSYAIPAFTSGWNPTEYIFTDDYVTEVTSTGAEWARSRKPPAHLERLWRDLVQHIDDELSESLAPVVVRLLAIADEASLGIGFAPAEAADSSSRVEDFSFLVFEQHRLLAAGQPHPLLPFLPSSLCRLVSDLEACVQPKTSVPTVGCTLRSLSHNLALLPPTGIVATSWLFMHPAEQEHKPFNLLLVPYPYAIDANHFSATPDCTDDDDCFFEFKAGWMDHEGKPAAAQHIAAVLDVLIKAARKESREVHGMILPEAALLNWQADEVAVELAKLHPDLELFISGTVIQEANDLKPRNCAYTARLYSGSVMDSWSQYKHHRWCLERGQIVRYHLGSVLDPQLRWWEKIDVSNRTCVFSVVRWGASLAVLVCEDLARFDPVLPVLSSVGPSLVVALLMDGPQLERRWPGRYATVLADDPGSSVLTLTSLGMIRRSTMPGESDQSQIALWKEAGDVAKELRLPTGAHALLLSLTTTGERQVTLDRRNDEGATRRFRLSGARAVRVDAAARKNLTEFDWDRYS